MQLASPDPHMFDNAGPGGPGVEGEEELGWHPSRRTSGTDLMRQGSHSSSFLSHSHLERPTQSGLLEQLISQDDNGLQVTPHTPLLLSPLP